MARPAGRVVGLIGAHQVLVGRGQPMTIVLRRSRPWRHQFVSVTVSISTASDPQALGGHQPSRCDTPPRRGIVKRAGGPPSNCPSPAPRSSAVRRGPEIDRVLASRSFDLVIHHARPRVEVEATRVPDGCHPFLTRRRNDVPVDSVASGQSVPRQNPGGRYHGGLITGVSPGRLASGSCTTLRESCPATGRPASSCQVDRESASPAAV